MTLVRKHYGQLFVEMTPYNGETYEWSTTKVSFKLSPQYLDELLYALKHPSSHKEIGTTLKHIRYSYKNLTLVTGSHEITYLFSDHEIHGLSILLEKAKGALYGW